MEDRQIGHPQRPRPQQRVDAKRAQQRRDYEAGRPLPSESEDSFTCDSPTFALGISHCPWLPDRAANMQALRPLLQNGSPYHEETDRAPNHVWSRRLWGWGAAQPVTHGVYLQDDLRIHDDFWAIVEAMVRAVPNRVIALISNHPMSERALDAGSVWYRMCETLGAGYIVPTFLMREFLVWRDRLSESEAAANCEDFLLSRWLYETERKCWSPIPSIIQTREEFLTTNPAIFYPYRRSYIPWVDPRVAGRPIVEVDYWQPRSLPPDFGFCVSQDTRMPASPFSNKDVLAAHQRIVARGEPAYPPPRKVLTLRVYPPKSDNVQLGLYKVLAGSYDVPGLSFSKPPRILDLGGHVGSATVFFADRFPGAKIDTYEPNPDNAAYCRKNVAGIATLQERAVVGAGPDRVTLRNGKDNTGECSIHDLGSQRSGGVSVETVCAVNLPPCDILKVDTEGCELEILRCYPHLKSVRAVMLEWHRFDDYRELLRWLPTLGFKLVLDNSKGVWLSDRNLIFTKDQAAMSFDGSVAGLRREYDLESLPDLQQPTVVDVGANRGNFARYVMQRYPGATVSCYEPNPQTFAKLSESEDLAHVATKQVAVTHPAKGKMPLFMGVNGDEECSLRRDIVWGPGASNPLPHCSQQLDTWIDVDTMDAADLPPCDILKVDTEGSEIEILTGYRHLRDVKILIVEAHAVGGDLLGQASAIRALAEAAGLRWFGPDPIVQRFVRP